MSVASLPSIDRVRIEPASQINTAPEIVSVPEADTAAAAGSAPPIESGSAIDEVRQWLLDYRPQLKEDHPEIADLDLDVDLIENRVIDSLGFMNFVFFLEELTGRELIAEAQSANSFRTLRIIEREILHGGEMSV